MESIVSLETVISRKYSLDGFFWFVEVIYDGMSIAFGWGSVDNDVVELFHFFQKPVTVWANVKLEDIFSYFESNISILGVSNRVNEGLIEIEDK